MGHPSAYLSGNYSSMFLNFNHEFNLTAMFSEIYHSWQPFTRFVSAIYQNEPLSPAPFLIVDMVYLSYQQNVVNTLKIIDLGKFSNQISLQSFPLLHFRANSLDGINQVSNSTNFSATDFRPSSASRAIHFGKNSYIKSFTTKVYVQICVKNFKIISQILTALFLLSCSTSSEKKRIRYFTEKMRTFALPHLLSQRSVWQKSSFMEK